MAIGATTNMQWISGQGGAAVRYTGENGVTDYRLAAQCALPRKSPSWTGSKADLWKK